MAIVTPGIWISQQQVDTVLMICIIILYQHLFSLFLLFLIVCERLHISLYDQQKIQNYFVKMQYTDQSSSPQTALY